MRVTETTVKNSQITILKHQAGTIYGLALHPIDQIASVGQRALKYYLRIILVEFEVAQWQREGLPLGVLPLVPVDRTWCVADGVNLFARRLRSFLIL